MELPIGNFAFYDAFTVCYWKNGLAIVGPFCFLNVKNRARSREGGFCEYFWNIERWFQARISRLETVRSAISWASR